MKNDKIMPDGNGTIYLQSGGIGIKQDSVSVRPAYQEILSAPGMSVFSAITVSADTIKIDTKTIDTETGTFSDYESFNIESRTHTKNITLTLGTDTSKINLTWYAPKSDGMVSAVKIATNPQMTNAQTFTGTATETYATENKVLTGQISHKVTATDLTANTKYYYSVSSDGNTFDEVYEYKTPGADKFTFAAIGDPQLTAGKQDSSSSRKDETTLQGWLDTMEAINAKGVDFIAGVGDQVDKTVDGDDTEYDNFFTPSALKNIPFAPAVGNHDRHYSFMFHYNLPNEQTFNADLIGTNTSIQTATAEAAGNYFYSYNNALFVVLNDSGYPTSKTEAETILLPRFKATLQAATSAYPDYTWLFVQHHKSTESVADHCADLDIEYYVEAGFEKLMDEFKVDFVLAGHDHVYARTYPMLNGIPNTDGASGTYAASLTAGGISLPSSTKGNGTTYFTTTTGSGLKYYELFNNAGNLYVKNNVNYPYLQNGKKGSADYAGINISNTVGGADNTHEVGTLPLSTAMYMQNKTSGYMYITVEADKVTFNYYDLDDYKGTPYDSYTVTAPKSVDNSAVDAVIAKIGAIPVTVTLAEKTKVTEARTAYEALTIEQKNLVTNYDKLVAAETRIAELESGAVTTTTTTSGTTTTTTTGTTSTTTATTSTSTVSTATITTSTTTTVSTTKTSPTTTTTNKRAVANAQNTDGPSESAPVTGDNTPITMVIIVGSISFAAMIILKKKIISKD